MKKFGVVLFSMMFLMMGTTSCFAEKISVYDNTTKNVENFEFDDDLDIDFKLEPKEGILSKLSNVQDNSNTDIGLCSIIGEDNRFPVTPEYGNEYYPIARLTITFPDGSVGYGTGYMISKYTMATAGHCIYDDENKCFATSITADFGTVGDSVSLSVPSDRIKTYVYYSGYPNESYSKESDYAFINYKLAIGQLTGTIGVDSDTVCVGDTVWVTGYPSDLGNCKYMYKGIGSVESVTDSLIKYDADTYRGQSGSPVYYKSGGKLYSYATHIYGGNYGRRLSSGLMTWLSDNGFLK